MFRLECHPMQQRRGLWRSLTEESVHDIWRNMLNVSSKKTISCE